MKPYVAIVGPGDADSDVQAVAYRTGELVAQSGAILLCGGRGGAMEAACRGAKSAGGTTVGILPGKSRQEANRFVDIALATGLGEARNFLVVAAADGVIAIGGGYGTLSEIGIALRLEKPIVGIATWMLERVGEAGIPRAESPEGAVEILWELFREEAE